MLIIGGLLLFLYMRYPVSYTHIIKQNSKEYDTDPYLIAAIINVESKYDRYAKSAKDAKGLMQITPATGKWASEMIGLDGYTEDDLYDPEINIKIGTWYVDRLLGEFDGDLDLALAAYNGGSGNVRKWLNDPRYSDDGKTLKHIPFEETRNYLDRVKKSYEIYSNKYQKMFTVENFEDDEYISLIHDFKKSFEEILSSK